MRTTNIAFSLHKIFLATQGKLEHLEEEVVSFFTSCAKDVFVCRIANSFERLLLHALSQYLDLLSHSKSPVVCLCAKDLSLCNEGLAIAAVYTLIKVYIIKEFCNYIHSTA